MKIIRSLSLVFAFLVPVTAIASPAVRAEAPCCPGPCCGDHCPMR
jgi:hypothetical protein